MPSLVGDRGQVLGVLGWALLTRICNLSLVLQYCRQAVADLGFHEGGFVRSGALVRPRNFLQTTPTSG